jgi:hypothetical protein
MNRPKLETTFKLERDPAPLVVNDFNVSVFRILNWYQNKIEGSFSPEVEEKLIKGAFALDTNRGPDMLPRHSYRILFVADCRYSDTGNYWRNTFMTKSPEVSQAWTNYAESKRVPLSSLPTSYKGQRSDKTDAFWTVYKICRDYAEEYFPFFTHEGYEADDIAGAIYRLSRDSGPESVATKRQILLQTIDRDWSQLVDEEHKVYFANTRVPFPNEVIQERLVGNQGVIEHTAHRMGFDLDHPKNLADWKVLHGDMGDNLPPGSPKCLFDLCEPNDDYNIEKVAPWFPDLVECVNDPKANDRPDHWDTTIRQFAKIALEAPVRW